MELTANSSLLTGTNKPAGISLHGGSLLHKRAERRLEVEDELHTHAIFQIGNAATMADLQKGKCGEKKKVLKHTFSLRNSRFVCQEPRRDVAPYQNVWNSLFFE